MINSLMTDKHEGTCSRCLKWTELEDYGFALCADCYRWVLTPEEPAKSQETTFSIRPRFLKDGGNR